MFAMKNDLACLESNLPFGRAVSVQERRYLVQLRAPGRSLFIFEAARFEIHGDHLTFLNSKGELLFLFLLESIESWNEL
jgi:hypothetical protein